MARQPKGDTPRKRGMRATGTDRGGDLERRDAVAKLSRYAALAHEHFETERFQAFCDRHLAHLDEVAWEFFGSETARDAVRDKVSVLYPAHEHEQFTELFWSRMQRWREEQARVAA